MTTKSPLLAALAAMVLSACGGGPPSAPMPVDTVIRVDTITITREVEPPLPESSAATVCLASGQNAEVRVTTAGDTLVGPRRVSLSQLGPDVGFIGDYAADETWFVNDTPVTFDRRAFSKFGQPQTQDCRTMKIVGDFNGVNLFADFAASAPFRVLHVPVSPGVFQSYQAQVGRVRG